MVSDSRAGTTDQASDRLGDEAASPLGPTPTSTSNCAPESLQRMLTHKSGRDVELGGADSVDTRAKHKPELQDQDHGTISLDHSEQDEEKQLEANDTVGGGTERKPAQLQDQTNLLPLKQVITVFCGLSVALCCALLDQTIVTTALPTLGRVFHRADISSWVGTSCLLTSTAMQPLYGRLSDIFGRKMCLLGALTIFLIGSVACAVAQSMIQLIIFRAIQGIGGGGINTLSMIIVSDIVSLKDRGKYQGVLGVVVAASNGFGPLIGGAFTQTVTWRWCFYINIPLSATALVIVMVALPLRRVKGSIIGKLQQVDWWGCALTMAWASLVLIALSWAGTQYAWDSAGVLAPLLIGLALLGVFLFAEVKMAALPLIPLRIFRNTSVAACMLCTFLQGMAFYASLYFLPMYFQIVRGASPIGSGILLLPLNIIQTSISFTSGIVQARTGDYYFNIVLGFSIWSIGLGLLSTINTTTSYARLGGFMALAGVGSGQTFQTSLVAIQANVDRRDMATATATRNFLRMLGGTIALAACSAIVNNVVGTQLRSVGLSGPTVHSIISSPDTLTDLDLTADQRKAVIYAYAKGIRGVFYLLIPCISASAVITAIFVKRVSLKRSDDAEKKAEARQWLEARKERHSKKRDGHEDAGLHEVPQNVPAPVEPADGELGTVEDVDHSAGTVHHVAHGVENLIEEAGRGLAEGGGVSPPVDDQPLQRA